MTTTKTRAAEALFPMLSIFHLINGQPLEAVWQVQAEGCSGDILLLSFGSNILSVSVIEDDDSIELSASGAMGSMNRVDVSGEEPWNTFLGKQFGWGWLTVNQQGYCDGVLLSFNGIVPQIMLNVVASSLKIGIIALSM